MSAVAVLGGGAWGTALALTAARAGNAVRLWARDPATVEEINAGRENPRYLPGIRWKEPVEATGDMAAALAGAGCVLLVTPAQTVAGLLPKVRPHLSEGAPLVICAKGIDRQSGRLLSELASESLPATPVAALSGPSFAADVARGLPTAVTIAASDGTLAGRLAALLSSQNFRCYSTDDMTGVELGAALKNVLAIAAGAVAGAGLGASAQAAMVTRGFVELRRIGTAFGARPETLMGLSGLGDLLLTCSSPQSRNFSYGLALGRGEPLERRPLAEGVATAGIAARLARERGVEAPIVDAVDRILSRQITVHDAVAALLSRPLKSESA